MFRGNSTAARLHLSSSSRKKRKKKEKRKKKTNYLDGGTLSRTVEQFSEFSSGNIAGSLARGRKWVVGRWLAVWISRRNNSRNTYESSSQKLFGAPAKINPAARMELPLEINNNHKLRVGHVNTRGPQLKFLARGDGTAETGLTVHGLTRMINSRLMFGNFDSHCASTAELNTKSISRVRAAFDELNFPLIFIGETMARISTRAF